MIKNLNQIKKYNKVMKELPEDISPCSNVRKSCNRMMNDPSFMELQDGGDTTVGRSVIIDQAALESFGSKIANLVLAQSKSKSHGEVELDDSKSENIRIEVASENKYLQFAAWDEEEWHYTGANYLRKNMSREEAERQRFERVALYIMVVDCINFCFWPVTDKYEKEMQRSMYKKNLLEYEHIASALKMMAEKDDSHDDVGGIENSDSDSDQAAEDSFAFAPQNLIKLTTESFLQLLTPFLPEVPENEQHESTYTIPNASERVRLLVEMGHALLYSHGGSATQFISKANRSSDKMVFYILQSFPGFRDAMVDSAGRWVAFYKRAQILVADLWAALGSEKGEMKYGSDVCNFEDMDKITTFADYRVPQLLRNVNVLVYSPQLSEKVDSKTEIDNSSLDEIYIRASTVVAVDCLVEIVKKKTKQDNINAVKMDWYLWNLGEKLDRSGSLENHHLVRTIFY